MENQWIGNLLIKTDCKTEKINFGVGLTFTYPRFKFSILQSKNFIQTETSKYDFYVVTIKILEGLHNKNNIFYLLYEVLKQLKEISKVDKFTYMILSEKYDCLEIIKKEIKLNQEYNKLQSILSKEIYGSYIKNKKDYIEIDLKFKVEDIEDRIKTILKKNNYDTYVIIQISYNLIYIYDGTYNNLFLDIK